jgi:U3 small nucleolar ribonucleoprotein protein IMP3
MLEKIPAEDSFREAMTKQLLSKLYDSGLINEKESLESAKKITVSAFMRRRFLVQVKLLKFVENL